MEEIRYLDFDLMIDRRGDDYQARVLQSPAGQAETHFAIPVSDADLKTLVETVGRPRRNVRGVGSGPMEMVKKFGGELFKKVFSEQVNATFFSSLFESERQECGLRIRLHLRNVPELSGIPWEFLFEPSRGSFLALSHFTPLVRYLDIQQVIKPLEVKSPLQALVMISSPKDLPRLDVQREWEKLKEAVRSLEEKNEIILDLLDGANFASLQRQLRQKNYHVFHFIGHGGFDPESKAGLLALETESGNSNLVSAFDLGTMLDDHRSLRLVILNSCEGSRSTSDDPFAGTAQSLVQKGVPAVIAMQFEITDPAAIIFSHAFYSAIADGYPVDASLAESRKAIFAEGNAIEWATPVLYLRSPDGKIFNKERLSSDPHPKIPAPIPKKPKEPLSPLIPIQTYKTDLARHGLGFTDSQGILWLSDGRDIELFELQNPHPLERWHLPELRWKTRLDGSWQNGMVLADWDGNLYMFNHQTGGRGKKLYNARYSDLPLHRLYVDENSFLAAASWDGKVMMWEPSGELVLLPPSPITPYLPTGVKPCGKETIAVSDQGNNLRVIDKAGKELWCYQEEGTIRDFWLSTGDDEKTANFFLLVDAPKIVNIKLGQASGKEMSLKSKIVSYSNLLRNHGEDETLLFMDEGGMEWFSWIPFRITTPSGLPQDLIAQKCFAFSSWQHKANRLSLWLDGQGNLFSADENSIQAYPFPPANRLALSGTKRFMYLYYDDRVEAYRNPALPSAPCHVRLENVSGTLSSSRYQEIRITLQNSGDVPICNILAHLSGKGVHLNTLAEEKWHGLLLPGEQIDLSFLAKASEAGKLLFVLDIQMQDEAGPPVWEDHLDFSIDTSV
ncbi:MAG: CHAT domain-containing protein [Chloroflexota bacterium]